MEDSVTVLMTTYNEEKHIFTKALESILHQTYFNLKILIIVDNKENLDITQKGDTDPINLHNSLYKNKIRIS